MDPKDRIYVALDVDTLVQAHNIIAGVRPYVAGFKVGLQFFVKFGPDAVREIIREEVSVFLDLKFKDIPNTMAGAAASAANLGVDFFNVHASAGIAGMRAAVEMKGLSNVLAVTVLTSFDEENAHLTYGAPIKAKVLQFARDALAAGVNGIVCSPKELQFLAKYPELKRLVRMIPGIRPKWSATNDQERVTTPAEAIAAGADYLVIGRPITAPPNGMSPREAAMSIVEELSEVNSAATT